MNYGKYINIFFTLYNHRYSEELDNIVSEIVANKDKCHVIKRDEYCLILLYNEKIYQFWVANKWYGYMSYVYIYDLEFSRENKHRVICDEINSFISFRPSRDTIYNFYEAFDASDASENYYSKTKMGETWNIIEEITKKYNADFEMLEIDFKFHQGEIYGLINKKKEASKEDTSQSQGDL